MPPRIPTHPIRQCLHGQSLLRRMKSLLSSIRLQLITCCLATGHTSGSYHKRFKWGEVCIYTFDNWNINGMLYALMSMGLILIVKAVGVLNFAPGQLFMLGAYITWMLTYPANLPLIGLLFAS